MRPPEDLPGGRILLGQLVQLNSRDFTPGLVFLLVGGHAGISDS